MREKIEAKSGIELYMAMAEGNPGAITVMMALAKRHGAVLAGILIAALDLMNIRGSQIWVAYKDFAGGDLDKLAEAIADNDPAMIARVNEECASYGEIARVIGPEEGSAA